MCHFRGNRPYTYMHIYNTVFILINAGVGYRHVSYHIDGIVQ